MTISQCVDEVGNCNLVRLRWYPAPEDTVTYLTHAMGVQTFKTLPAEFDSHAAERAMRKLYGMEFQQELDRFRGKKDPLKSFSQAFGMWLRRHFPNHITSAGRRPKTLSLRNTISENQLWKKL
jgi:hypothetical protein